MKKILYIGATILSVMSVNTIPLMAVPNGQSVPKGTEGMPVPPPKGKEGIVSPTGNSPVAEFECRTRGINTGKITFTADRKYKLPSGIGKYSTFTNSFGIGYRFLTGPAQKKSIVRQKGGIFLVGTPQETQAAELAARDAALVCTGAEINY
jgi:hypothetical protein